MPWPMKEQSLDWITMLYIGPPPNTGAVDPARVPRPITQHRNFRRSRATNRQEWHSMKGLPVFDFLQIRKSVDSLQRTIDEISTEQRQIASDVNRLTSAPAARTDMHDIVRSWVRRSAAQIPPAIAQRMAARHASGQALPHDVGLIAALQGPAGAVTAEGMDAALCALFPAQVEKVLCGAVDAMDWPGEGLPQAERAAEISRLQARERTLATEKAELLAKAREAGLDV